MAHWNDRGSGMRACAALVAIAQILVAPGALSAQEIRALKIEVVGGESAFNDIKNKRGRNVEVVVTDQSDRPVAGASVIFQAPTTGPSATFPDGRSSFMTTTSDAGRAATVGLQPNSVEGRFTINVSASTAGLIARTTVAQTNTLAGGEIAAPPDPATAKKSHKKTFIILAIVGGAAAAGVIAATAGGSSSAAAPAPIPGSTVSVGTVTVGGPR